MANIYVDSAATGTGTGASWVNATTTLAAGITASAAGDDIYIRNTSAETQASAMVLTFKGTATSPNRVFSTTNANTPPTTADLTAGASVTTTGNNAITMTGYVYIYGVTFNNGTGTTQTNFTMAGTASEMVLDTCAIKNLVTTATSNINLLGDVNSKVVWNNTTVTFNGGTGCTINANMGPFIWKNTTAAVLGTQTAIANLITPKGQRAGVLICDSVDFKTGTGIASGKNIIAASGAGYAIQLINCLTTTVTQIARPTLSGTVVDQIITDSGATGYKQQRDTYQGTLDASTTVYNNATDSVTPISWRVITTANCFTFSPFECFEIVQWAAAGTYNSSKVFLTSATAALKTNDVWVDVEYLGSSYALGSPATSFGAGSGTATLPLIPGGTTPGTLAAASPAWGTGGLGNDYQLVIPPFTTSAAGYVRFLVKVGKASLTVHVDPAVTIA